MKTIAFLIEAGGSGKSALCFNAARLMSGKYRVLVLDADGQAANLSFFAGIQTEEGQKTLYDVLMKGALIDDCIRPVKERFDIVPADDMITLISRTQEVRTADLKSRLAQALEALEGRYDYVLIDASPSPNILHYLIVNAVDYVVLPVLPDAKSVQSLKGTLQSLSGTQAGIVFNRFQTRSRMARTAVDAVQVVADRAGIPIFESRVRQAVAVSEALAYHVSVPEYQLKAAVSDDMMNFVKELIAKVG